MTAHKDNIGLTLTRFPQTGLPNVCERCFVFVGCVNGKFVCEHINHNHRIKGVTDKFVDRR